MEAPTSSPPTRRKNLMMKGEDGRGPYDDDDDDDEDRTREQRGDTSTNNCNRRLSFDGSLSERD